MPDPTPPVAPKSFKASKTLWVNLIIAVVAFFPEAKAWVQNHPTESLAIVSVVNAALRFLTKGKISLYSETEKLAILPLVAIGSLMLAGGACARPVPAHVEALRTSTYLVPHVTATPAPLQRENERFLPIPAMSESDLIRALETGQPLPVH